MPLFLPLALSAAPPPPAVAPPQQKPFPQLWPQPATRRINESASTNPGPFYDACFTLPEHDPLKIKTGMPWKGVFTYLPLVTWSSNDPENKTRYFIFRGQGVLGQLGTTETPKAAYPAANGEGDCFDPQLSPNLQGLAFKSGYHWDDGHGSSRVFYWDFKDRSIRRLTDFNVFFPQVKWSPRGSYIAYAIGGDSPGNEDDGPTTLAISEASTARVTEVVKHPVLRDQEEHDFRSLPSFSWSSDNTLLFSAPHRSQPSNSLRPSIFETSVPSSKPKKIIPAGYAPLPSPDNKWIAFLGWPTPPPKNKAPTNKRAPIQLCLFNRQTSKVVALKDIPSNSAATNYLTDLNFCWTPDSKSLLIISSRFQLDARRPNTPL